MQNYAAYVEQHHSGNIVKSLERNYLDNLQSDDSLIQVAKRAYYDNDFNSAESVLKAYIEKQQNQIEKQNLLPKNVPYKTREIQAICDNIKKAEECLKFISNRQASQVQRLANVNTNDPKLNFELGIRYLFGKGGLPKDTQKALNFLEKACENGNANAMATLGVIYWNGLEDVASNKNKAQRIFSQIEDRRLTEHFFESVYQRPFSGLENNNLAQAFYDSYADYRSENDGCYTLISGKISQGNWDVICTKFLDNDKSRKEDVWNKVLENSPGRETTAMTQRAFCRAGRMAYDEGKKFFWSGDRNKQYEKAVSYWKQAAEAGHVASGYYLGLAMIPLSKKKL